MPPKVGELQIMNYSLGQPIAGKVFWLYGYETVGAVELESGESVVAVKLFPGPGNPDFKEPLVIMLALQNIDNFLKAIRIAEAGLHPAIRDGGTA